MTKENRQRPHRKTVQSLPVLLSAVFLKAEVRLSRPGAGAGKTLPEVGDIFITGIVNVSGSFEQLLLQTTRLATIFHMAESISQGILLACRELEAAGTSELLL